MLAVKKQNNEIVDILLKESNIDVNVIAEDGKNRGKTAFIIAAMEGNDYALQKLIDHTNANEMINHKDAGKKSAIIWAAMKACNRIQTTTRLRQRSREMTDIHKKCVKILLNNTEIKLNDIDDHTHTHT